MRERIDISDVMSVIEEIIKSRKQESVYRKTEVVSLMLYMEWQEKTVKGQGVKEGPKCP